MELSVERNHNAGPTQYPGEKRIAEIERERAVQACDELLQLLIEHHADKHRVIKLMPKPTEERPKVMPVPAPVIPLPVCIPEPVETVRLPSIAMVLTETADFYSLSVLDLKSARRHGPIVRARQIAMYLARTLTLRSFPEIGRRIGDKDHTTVLHGVRKIGELVKKDDRLNDEIEVLKLRVMEAVLNVPA